MYKNQPKSNKISYSKTAKKPLKRSVKSSKTKGKKLYKPYKLKTKVIALVFIVLFASVGSYFLLQSQAAPARLEKFVNNKERGMFWDDLEEGPAQGPCKGLLVPKNPAHKKDSSGKEICTHGPDPAPEDVDVRDSVEPVRTGEKDKTALAKPGVAYAQTNPASSIPCEGDGQSGNRVQFIYVHASDKPNRYSTFAESFQSWVAATNAAFAESATQTGGVRNLRIVTDANCRAVIPNVTVTATGDDSWSTTWSELQAQGYKRTDRKYVLFVDAVVYCGIGDLRYDDQPGGGNSSNFGPSFSRVDSGCWSLWDGTSAAAHELMHNLGGVQPTTPHADGVGHCSDDWDRMCYRPGGWNADIICADRALDRQFDCNKDDYFYAGTPPAGSYLATHWNTANSVFLTSSNNLVALAPPPTGCTPGPNHALIYSEINFGGTCKTLAYGYGYPNQTDLHPVPHVGSVRVGENIKISLCWSANYQPVCDMYSADAPTLVHPYSSMSALLGLRSGSNDTTPPPPPPPSDTIVPSVSISQPTSGTIIRNSTPITANAVDNVGVKQMQIYIDGQLKATSTTGSISYNWNSKKASRGNHIIIVKASDAAGNIGQISVTVTK